MLVIFIFSEAGFSEEQRRNPFKDWFPVIKVESKEEVTIAEPVIIFEGSKETFNASIYNVDGLIWGYKPKAIINNDIYGIGDKLGKAEIVRIDKDGVALVFNDEEYVISTEKAINIEGESQESHNEYEEERGVYYDN